MRRSLLYFLYVVICFAIYPILRYGYFRFFDPYTPESKFYVFIRVHLSMPLLTLSGIILIVYFKKKGLGFVSIGSGILVALLILDALSSF